MKYKSANEVSHASYLNSRQVLVRHALTGFSRNKGPARCCLCGHWMGPPYDFHKYNCPAGPLLRALDKQSL